jgi:hypothetical protein
MPESTESLFKKSRLKFYLLLSVMIVLGVIWWQFGSPVYLVTRWWNSANQNDTIKPTATSLPNLASTPFWNLLESYGVLPIQIGESGRANPFVYQPASPSASQRDEQRLKNIRQFTNSLAAYYKDYGQYPVATNLVLGGADSICLTDKGWVNLAACSDSQAKVIMARVPADPGVAQYIYSSTGPSYGIIFMLENSWGTFAPGSRTLTPTGIR